MSCSPLGRVGDHSEVVLPQCPGAGLSELTLMTFSPLLLSLGWAGCSDTMGSCCSCLNRDSIPDNHPTKFKVPTAPALPSSQRDSLVPGPELSSCLRLSREGEMTG